VDQVRVKIADDSEVGGQPIQVDAHNGVVVLTGKVTKRQAKGQGGKDRQESERRHQASTTRLAISPN